ncbi:MAG: hypothetical protein GY855_11445, partial [candidate division Zixibacteria bacterium]|nr:hypothetical protein [candidate division Zixibacteria bacterium]
LDALSEVDPEIGEGNGIIIIDKMLSRFLETNTPQEIKKDMQDLMDDINDPDYQEDFIDLSKLLGRLFIQSDTSMWVNKATKDTVSDVDAIDPQIHEDLDIGNAVEGQHLLMLWLNKMINNPETRELLQGIVKELADIFDPDPGVDNGSKLRPLIYALEDHFTKGGEVYDSDPSYHTDNDEIYTNAELGETIKDIFPFLMQLSMRSDRPNSIVSDKDNEKFYPMQRMMANLNTIKWDPDTANLEKSVYHMLRHDIFGRDRVTDPDANHISHFEHLL